MQKVPAAVWMGAVVCLVTLWAGGDAAPTLLTVPGHGKPPDPPASGSNVGGRSESAADSDRVKRWNLSLMTPNPARRGRPAAATSSPSRRGQMLKLLSALEELHRAMNGSMSSRITMMSRANGRNSGKKSKTMTAEDNVKTTTVSSVEARSTTSKASTDGLDPSSLSGRAFKKSLPSQPKKPNKRVCFWKYCSQN